MLLSAINYVGVRHGGRLQAIATAVKVAAIALIIIAGLVLDVPAVSSSAAAAGPVTAGAFILGVGAGLFAFGGWHMVTYAAGETVDAARTIPRALIIGTLAVTICYAGLNAVYLRVLPLDEVRHSTRIAADAAAVMFGSRGAQLVSLLVLVSSFGA